PTDDNARHVAPPGRIVLMFVLLPCVTAQLFICRATSDTTQSLTSMDHRPRVGPTELRQYPWPPYRSGSARNRAASQEPLRIELRERRGHVAWTGHTS